jgi:hypothetical protein
MVAPLVVGWASCRDIAVPFVGGAESRSQFFEYHDQVNEPLCPTLLSLLDQHAQQIGGKIGLTLTGSEPPFRYYKFRSFKGFIDSQVCPPEAGGCVYADHAYSSDYFQAHEQAHLYVFRAWGGFSTGLLNEGEAVALSCEPLRFIEPNQRPADVVRSAAWRDLVSLSAASTDAVGGYVAAGYFVTYLVNRFGWSSLMQLHRRVPINVSADDLARSFVAVYPLSLDDAWSAALGTAGAQPCFKDWLCSATPMAVGEDAPLGCDGQMHRTVTVTNQAGVGLSIHGGNGEITLVGGCSDAAPSWIELIGGLSTRATHWVNLKPGTYTIADLIATGGPADVAFRGYLPQGFLGNTCATAGTIALDSGGDTFIDLLLGQVSGWTNISGGGGQTFAVNNYGIAADLSASGVVEVCDGCGAAATCVSLLPENSIQQVTLSDHAVLHLQNAFVDPGTSNPQDPGPYIAFYPPHSGS